MENLRPSILQRPQDLQLAVLLDDSLSDLMILRSAQVTCGAWHFEFAIIGESHFVLVLHRGEFFMQEVLACVDLPPAARGHVHALDQHFQHHYQHERYHVQVDASYTPDDVPAGYDGLLEYAFPQTYGITPITRIVWWQTPERLRWHTLHTYPAHDHITYVVSDSHFDMVPEE